jgi:hypothetical protein
MSRKRASPSNNPVALRDPMPEVFPVEVESSPPPFEPTPAFRTHAPLTWGDVWNFIKRHEYVEGEGFTIDLAYKRRREEFFALPVWDDHVICIPVWWKVGTNEDYYLVVETMNRPGRGEDIAPRVGRLMGKLTTAPAAAEAVASIQLFINQHQGMGDGSLWTQPLPVTFRYAPYRPSMEPGALAHMLVCSVLQDTTVVFHAASSGAQYRLVIKGRMPFWFRGERPDEIAPYLVPSDLVHEYTLIP